MAEVINYPKVEVVILENEELVATALANSLGLEKTLPNFNHLVYQKFKTVEQLEAHIQDNHTVREFIIDLKLEGDDIDNPEGLSALEVIRKFSPHTRPLVYTGHTSDEYREKCQNLGVHEKHFIPKGILTDDFQIIRGLLKALFLDDLDFYKESQSRLKKKGSFEGNIVKSENKCQDVKDENVQGQLIIVENDASLAQTYFSLLNIKNYFHVAFLTSFEQTIAFLGNHSGLKVFIIDIDLKDSGGADKSGLDIAKELVKRNEKLLIIIYTGYADLRSEAQGLGFNACFLKLEFGSIQMDFKVIQTLILEIVKMDIGNNHSVESGLKRAMLYNKTLKGNLQDKWEYENRNYEDIRAVLEENQTKILELRREIGNVRLEKVEMGKRIELEIERLKKRNEKLEHEFEKSGEKRLIIAKAMEGILTY